MGRTVIIFEFLNCGGHACRYLPAWAHGFAQPCRKRAPRDVGGLPTPSIPINRKASFGAEQIHVDVVGLEGLGVLAKPDRLQPFADLAHALSCSSNALASLKSSVSKPSVNHPWIGARRSWACCRLP